MKRLIIAGGSGFLGSVLASALGTRGWDIVTLSRFPRPASPSAPRTIYWDGQSPGDWQQELEGAHAVINLAGRSVNCRYTHRNRAQIMDSRILPTRAIGNAIRQCRQPPLVWLNSSTATIYRHTFGTAWNEDGLIGATREAKDSFSIDVARAWEEEFFRHALPHTGMAALRTAIVLSARPGTMLAIIATLARLGLGGQVGDGRQWVSWIHEADFCRAVEFVLTRDDFAGIVNVAAPTPVTNADMMQIVRDITGRRFGLPVTRWMLEIGAFFHRTEAELVIKSRRVVPGRLIQAGFEFQHPTMQGAVSSLLARPDHRQPRASHEPSGEPQ